VPGTGALPWHFGILTLIDLNPGLTQVALARAIRRDTSSLTSVLDDLCNRGLVSRVRPEHDRRSYALRLTPRGLKAMEELKEKVRSHERELDRMFTREQRSLLIEMLGRIASELADSD
jgi:DNA-binding MarR family transcriptional regulator